MAIDARIPLGVQQFNLADVLRNVESIKGAQQDRQYRAQTMRRQDEEDKRAAQFRGALAEFILSNGASAPSTPPMVPMGGQRGGMAAPAPAAPPVDPLAPLPEPSAAPASAPSQGGGMLASMLTQPKAEAPAQPAGPSRDDAFRRMVLADPKNALEARKAQFEHVEGQLDMISRLAGSAVDQPSYERALQRASSMGLDVSHLPPQFNPQLVTQVLNEALDAKDRLGSMRADRKLEWDITDDVLDNERADENLDSLEGYRSGSLANTRRGQDLTDARGRRGQDMVDKRVRSGSGSGKAPGSEGALYTSIRAKWMRGEPINPREKAFAEDYERRRNARDSRGRSGRAGRAAPGAGGAAVKIRPNEPVSKLADGRLAVVRNGQWVPAER